MDSEWDVLGGALRKWRQKHGKHTSEMLVLKLSRKSIRIIVAIVLLTSGLVLISPSVLLLLLLLLLTVAVLSLTLLLVVTLLVIPSGGIHGEG